MEQHSDAMEPLSGYYDHSYPGGVDLVDAAINARREMLSNSERPDAAYYGHDRTSSWNDSQATTPCDRRTLGSTYSYRNPTHISLQLPYNTQSPVGHTSYSPIQSDEPLEPDIVPASQPPRQPSGPPEIPFSTTREILFIANVCLAQLFSLAALAQTVAPLLLIGADLNVTNPGQLSWFTASFSMTLGTFILPAGRIGDMIGHKKIFLLGWLWFALFSLICGFSYISGPIMLSIARGFQGIGPALLVPNALALIGRTFPMGVKRNIVISIYGACGPVGWTIGAVMSALLAEKVSWSYAFFAMTIACIIISVLSFLVIPDSLAVRAGPPGAAAPKFDYNGAFTGVVGLVLINFALNQAPLVGWQTPYVYFILVIGIMITAFFVVIELRYAESPLLPLHDLQPNAAFTLACIGAGWASHGIWIYYINLFLMRVRGLSPLLAQGQTCTVAITGTVFALSTGFLLNHIHVSTLMFLAMTVFFVGTALIAFAPPQQSYWAQTFVSVLIMPGGMNWSFPAGTILLSNAMPKEMQGKAASLVSTVVNYSIATGLGLAGTVERSVNGDGTKTLEGYRGAWYLGMGFSGLGMVISTFFILTSKKEEIQKVRNSARPSKEPVV